MAETRDEIFNFLDRINTQLTRRNDFDKDFIMKACLVLTDLPVAYKVQHFNNANLATIRQYWPNIKRAIEQDVDLANSFGIDRDKLTSANALIPVVYYLFKHNGVNLRGSNPFEARNANRTRRCLIMALFNGVFGGTSDNMLRDIRASMQGLSGSGADFPLEAINLTIRKAARPNLTISHSTKRWLAPTGSSRLFSPCRCSMMRQAGGRCSSTKITFLSAVYLTQGAFIFEAC